MSASHPTPSELRRGEAAAWGKPPPGERPSMRLLRWKPVVKNSLRGFADVELPNGLVINDVVVGEASDRQWALLPSKAMIDRDGELMRDFGGKPRHAPVIEWSSREVRDEFSRRVVDLVRAQYPGAFDQ